MFKNLSNQLLISLGIVGLVFSGAFFILAVVVVAYAASFTRQLNILGLIKIVAILTIPVGLSGAAIVIGNRNLRR